MVNAPQVSLKIIVFSHFVLTVWASMPPGFLPPAYIYMNGFVLAFGVWAMVATESVDSILSFFVINLLSILLDVVFLGIFAPLGHANYERPGQPLTNTYRFGLGMSIVNLIIKPFTSFVLYRLYQDRGGQYSDFGIPGMPNFGGRQGPYENIDNPIPSNNVETASPHHSIDDKPLP